MLVSLVPVRLAPVVDTSRGRLNPLMGTVKPLLRGVSSGMDGAAWARPFRVNMSTGAFRGLLGGLNSGPMWG